MKNKSQTAEELLSQLRQDEVYQKILKEKEKKRIEFERLLTEDAKPLINDLAKAGLKISSAWDLVNTSVKYPEAIPILIKHLRLPYHERNKEGIIRALTVKEAKGLAALILLKEFEKIDKNNFQMLWVIGNALTVVMTDNEIDLVIKIVNDEKNGRSRGIFIKALSKFRNEKVENCLINLLNDKEVLIPVIEALGKMKSVKSEKQLKKLLKSKDSTLVEKVQRTIQYKFKK